MGYGSLRVKATGGSEVKKLFFDIFFIWLSRATCKKPHLKINFLAKVILFSKSHFACNYTMYSNFNSKYLKMAFRYIFWEHWMTYKHQIWYILTSGTILQFECFRFWKFWFFSILWAALGPLLRPFLPFFRLFSQ